jgi:hypothetical protein
MKSKQRRIRRHRVNLRTNIQYLPKNGCHAAKDRCTGNGVLELHLSRVHVSIQIGKSDLEMRIDSVGSGTGVEGNPARSGGKSCSDLPAEHVRMKSVV